MLGSAIVRQLLEHGHSVRVLKRATSRTDVLGEAAAETELVDGDIMVYDDVRKAVEGMSVVFHAAAVVGFSNSSSDDPYEPNYTGTANLIDASLEAGVDRFVHTSSIAAIGRDRTTDTWVDESRKWTPSPMNSRYAVSKHKAEMEVYRGIAEGLDAVMVNPSLIFGECRTGDNTSAIIQRVQKGKVPGIPVGGTNVVDVLDVANGHLLALERGKTGERYILGGENLLWRDILETIASESGVQLTNRTLTPRLMLAAAYAAKGLSRILRREAVLTPETARISSRYFRYDISKAATELGYSHRPFRATINRLVNLNHDQA